MTKVWAAGVAAPALARKLAEATGGALDRAGRIKVNPDTSLPGHPEIFVVGDARFPGSYTVSGLSTITSALFAAGGIKPIGSMRDVQLKRQGQTVRHLDLYDLLLHGDTSQDVRVVSGDVIFIPPVGSTVSVYGEV